MLVTMRIQLTDRELRRFEEFHSSHQAFLNNGDMNANEVANVLKPFVDNNWDKYQAWKKEMGL